MKKKRNTKQNLKLLGRFLKGSRLLFAASVLFAIVTALCDTVNPQIIPVGRYEFALGGGQAATSSESFGPDGLLEPPQYTHPPEFRGMRVPEVLLSGDHRRIEAWRKSEARRLTEALRPDLVEGGAGG